MDTRADINTQEKTIPAFSGEGDSVIDYAEVRQDFGIYPGEDGLKYRDLKLLGMGGMGIVYSGEDPTLERRVAIKVLREPFRNDRSQIAKFINEARITARIDHPNIVAVHQLGVNEHHGVYFSMRQIGGETLLHVIRRLQDGDEDAMLHYTPRRLLDIFIAGCNGVAAAHEKKILHCDLKPANIMIGRFGEVLVLDWGLAREFDDRTLLGNKIAGTPAYMAPELLSGEQKRPDERSEVYALGAILFAILTREAAPFDLNQTNEEIMEKAVCGRTLPLRAPRGQSLSRELAAICRKAMHCDREKRYASVTELLDDLYNYRDGRAVNAYSPNMFYRFCKLCLRHPAIPIAVMVALLTLGCYTVGESIFEYMHDRSLLRSSQINLQIADGYYHRTIHQYRKFHEADLLDDPVKIAIAERNMLLQSNLAMMEFFSVLDSSSGLSSSGMDEFVRLYAADIFKNIITLQLTSGDIEKMNSVLERCRRWNFFDTACAGDPVLAKKVRQIENGVGTVNFQCESGMLRGRLKPVNGDWQDIEIGEKSSFELKGGNYLLIMENGMKARFRVVPGGDETIILPEVLPPGSGTVIPGDHFYFEIPGSGSVRCDLPAFVISKYSGRGYFTVEHAAEVIKEKNAGGQQWRLPRAAELMKVWSGENFYEVGKSSGPVLLHNGDLFDPETSQIIRSGTEKGGELYLIRDLQ